MAKPKLLPIDQLIQKLDKAKRDKRPKAVKTLLEGLMRELKKLNGQEIETNREKIGRVLLPFFDSKKRDRKEQFLSNSDIQTIAERVRTFYSILHPPEPEDDIEQDLQVVRSAAFERKGELVSKKIDSLAQTLELHLIYPEADINVVDVVEDLKKIRDKIRKLERFLGRYQDDLPSRYVSQIKKLESMIEDRLADYPGEEPAEEFTVKEYEVFLRGHSEGEIFIHVLMGNVEALKKLGFDIPVEKLRKFYESNYCKRRSESADETNEYFDRKFRKTREEAFMRLHYLNYVPDNLSKEDNEYSVLIEKLTELSQTKDEKQAKSAAAPAKTPPPPPKDAAGPKAPKGGIDILDLELTMLKPKTEGDKLFSVVFGEKTLAGKYAELKNLGYQLSGKQDLIDRVHEALEDHFDVKIPKNESLSKERLLEIINAEDSKASADDYRQVKVLLTSVLPRKPESERLPTQAGESDDLLEATKIGEKKDQTGEHMIWEDDLLMRIFSTASDTNKRDSVKALGYNLQTVEQLQSIIAEAFGEVFKSQISKKNALKQDTIKQFLLSSKNVKNFKAAIEIALKALGEVKAEPAESPQPVSDVEPGEESTLPPISGQEEIGAEFEITVDEEAEEEVEAEVEAEEAEEPLTPEAETEPEVEPEEPELEEEPEPEAEEAEKEAAKENEEKINEFLGRLSNVKSKWHLDDFEAKSIKQIKTYLDRLRKAKNEYYRIMDEAAGFGLVERKEIPNKKDPNARPFVTYVPDDNKLVEAIKKYTGDLNQLRRGADKALVEMKKLKEEAAKPSPETPEAGQAKEAKEVPEEAVKIPEKLAMAQTMAPKKFEEWERLFIAVNYYKVDLDRGDEPLSAEQVKDMIGVNSSPDIEAIQASLEERGFGVMVSKNNAMEVLSELLSDAEGELPDDLMDQLDALMAKVYQIAALEKAKERVTSTDIDTLAEFVMNNETLMPLLEKLDDIRKLITDKDRLVKYKSKPAGFKSVESFAEKVEKMKATNHPLVRTSSNEELAKELLKLLKKWNPKLFKDWDPVKSPKKLEKFLSKSWQRMLDDFKK